MLGALLLCGLAICAFGATSASAAGLTAVECVEVAPGTGKYNTSACLTPQVPGNFETKVIEGEQEVEGKATRTIGEGHGLGSTANPVAVFHSIVAGIKLTITCGTGTTTGGKVKNQTVGEEMQIHVTGSVNTYSECHAALENGTKICEVEGVAPAAPKGSIATNKTTGITGPNHTVTIKSEKEEEGKPIFTKLRILGKAGCFTPVNIEITVTGEAMGTADTTTHSHLTVKEPWPCTAEVPCEKLKANGAAAAQTVTGTGFTKGTTKVVGAETF